MSERAPPPDRGLLVFALAIVLFMASLDQTVVGTALPRIAAELGGLEWYAWVFTAYMLATTTVVPIAGKLGDQYGRRTLLAVGIVEFLIASGLAGFADSMEMLIAMRALQGIGAGVLVAAAQAAVGDLFPPAQLGKYNGMLSGVHALASLVGPLLGGAITDAFGWRWVFLVNLPIALLALVVVLRRFHVLAPTRAREPIDLRGMVLMVVAIVGWLLVFNELADALAGEWQALALAGATALIGSVAFVAVELRSASPTLPLRLLAERELRVTLLITFACGLAIYAAAIFTPLLLQGALGLSPSRAGLAMTPMVFGLVLGGIGGGVWVSRVGRYRATIGLGMLIAALASALLASTASNPSEPSELSGLSVTAVAGLLGVVGIGVGMTIPASMSAAQNVVSHAELGLATALSKFARNFGGIVGLGVLGAVLQLRTFARLAPGMADVLGESDDAFARELARDPSALLSDAPTLDHPALVEQPQRLDALLELLRAALADASARVLWGVALTLALAALLTLRSRDRVLRSDFDTSGSGS